MFTVERKRNLTVPAERVRTVLSDVGQMSRLMPRTERVEILSESDNRARVGVVVRLGRLGTQRVEGEARRLDDGVRFVAVQPMEIDVRWTIVPREDGCTVLVRLVTELPRKFASFARFVPARMVEDRIGAELDSALDALVAATAEPGQDAGTAPAAV